MSPRRSPLVAEMERRSDLEVQEGTKVTTNLKLLIALIAGLVSLTAGGAIAYASITHTIEDHTRQLVIATSDHDKIIDNSSQIKSIQETLNRMDRKLDYLTGARAQRPPATPVP